MNAGIDAVAVREFEALWAREQEPDLLRAALRLAWIQYPELDLAEQEAEVEHLAHLATQRLAGSPTEHTSLLRLNHFFFDEFGFRGDLLDYYDPRNSFLNDVIDRRTGIPISLSALYMAVGTRAGLTLNGIGLPAHFVVRHEATDPAWRVYVDVFNRQVLPNREACRRLVSRIAGRSITLEEQVFLPQSVRDIILRMLANLKGAYLRLNDFLHAVAVLDLILVLQPEDPQQWRDRGLLHYQLDNYDQASFDLQRYLWLVEDVQDKTEQVTQALETIQRLRMRLN
jgi:regulator of sirC expression with transglutaminase-like and TPR domain